MANLKLVCALLVCLLVTAPISHAIDCSQVTSDLAPCLGYLRSDGEGSVSADCCSGLQEIYNSAQTTQERQETCQCLQDDAKSVYGINSNAAADLPSKCGISVSYQISTSTNCSSIQ